MCGILGVIGENRDDRFRSDILLHRGPDASGVWMSSLGDYPITLAHTRLSIIDRSESGNQPMESYCGRYVIVFNGEIYNYLELRESLIAKGYKFKTKTDTEVLLAGLIAVGHRPDQLPNI
jgi:asparagine synthase (glutamine-hydrolysing)